MVKLGLTRAYGTSLRKAIAAGTNNRFIGFASGAFTTILLQSSTATALLLISFARHHAIPTASALGVVLGADVATTFVAQILSLDLSWLSPALLMAGIISHMKFEHGGRKRHISRALIGLGLMLLALSLIREVSAPLRDSATLPLIMAPLNSDPVLAIIVAALLAWLLHSSLASVLLLAALTANQIIGVELGLMMIMGVNLGGAFMAFALTFRESDEARRITIGNIAMKMAGIGIFIFLMPWVMTELRNFDDAPHRMMINFHTVFNVGVGLLFLPLTPLVAMVVEKFMPVKTNNSGQVTQYIDENMLGTPVVALAAAARETLHLAELIEDIFKKSLKALEEGTDPLIKTIHRSENKVDKIFTAIKLYMTRLSQEGLDPKEADRYIQVLTFATNLEHIGDIIDKSLIDLAEKKRDTHENFSEEGLSEIRDFHARVLANMKLAQAIFMSEDPKLAAQLVEEKGAIRAVADETSTKHFKRLQSGKRESIATSSLHLDIVRDYRRINSYITRVAYAIIENAQKHEGERKES